MSFAFFFHSIGLCSTDQYVTAKTASSASEPSVDALVNFAVVGCYGTVAIAILTRVANSFQHRFRFN
jgi:hypothetical protein